MIGTWFPSGARRKFWKQLMLVIVAHCKCTEGNFNMVILKQFTLTSHLILVCSVYHVRKSQALCPPRTHHHLLSPQASGRVESPVLFSAVSRSNHDSPRLGVLDGASPWLGSLLERQRLSEYPP
jgi:hypothetical protein